MAELDKLDKKIINALNQDVRASYSTIARKVRSSKEVVNYRVQRLIKQGIIKEFVTIFGYKYWAHKILAQLEKLSPEDEKELLDYLSTHPNVNWVTPCSGSYDVIFAVMAKNATHFHEIMQEIMGKVGRHIHDYRLGISVGSTTFGHTYILGSVHEPKPVKRHSGLEECDEKDKQIAAVLRTDARARLLDIASKTKIPVDTVKYRIKRMEENSIIRRYRLVLDPSKLGYNRYEIFIKCGGLTRQVANKFLEYGKQNPNVEFFSKLVGGWDIEYTVHFKNTQDFRAFVLDMKKEFGQYIHAFESVTLFDTLNFVYWPGEIMPAPGIQSKQARTPPFRSPPS